MIRARNAGQPVQPSAFRFRLRSLFVVTAACAILSALYGYFGNAVILLLLLAAAAFLAVTWIIDASLATREILIAIFRRRSSRDERDREYEGGGDVTRERVVEHLRNHEQIATARYNAAEGPLEDVLRARAVRLLAEIELLREKAARRRMVISERR